MLRLRTTTALSVLALGVGIAGTVALSAQTSRWVGAPMHMAQADAHVHPLRNAGIRPVPRLATRTAHRPTHPALPSHPVVSRVAETAVAATEPPSLRPLAMPNAATPFKQLRNHLSGSVVLRLDVDGEGRVRTAALSQSSGDAVLDAHALRMVRDWRFAVPADHPQGISGELPMRFDSVDQLAGAL